MNILGKILIVDDEEANLRFLEQVLTLENYGVAKARDGIEALDKFDKYQPDIVLLDVMMPRLDGFEVCRRLKNNIHTQSVPIIMLTALAEQQTKLNALKIGADEFLAKPIDQSELIARIRSLLRLRHCLEWIADQKSNSDNARAELATLREQINKAQQLAQAAPDSTLARAIGDVVESCKRLDQLLTKS
jgi:adenylate cyclase